MYQLAGRLLQGLVQGARRAAPQARFARTSLIDTATDPKTYQGLAQSASDTLGRALPPQFRGAGFQNVPTSALGALDNAAAAPFAGPARQQVLNKASKEFRRQAGSGTTKVPVIPTGGQPVNVSAGGRYTTLPNSTPLTNAQKLGIVSGATGVTGTGAVLATNGDQSIEDRLNQVGPAIDRFVGGLNFPGQQMLANFGREQEKQGFGSMLNFGPGGLLGPVVAPFMPNTQVASPRNYGANYKEQELEAFRKAELSKPLDPVTGPPLTGLEAAQVPPGLPIRPDRETPVTRQVTPENGNLTTPIDLPAPQPDPKIAPTPAENVGAMDPYAYQLSVYGQGRQAAASQQSQAAVRDLGLAIHQRLYPQFYADKDNVPTSEAQLPNSMNQKDANSELGASTLAVEQLLDPEIIQQLNAMNLRKTGY